MTNNKHLILTSPDNPIALAVYMGTVILGLLNATGVQVAQGMVQMIGTAANTLWALACIGAGVTAWWGAYAQKRSVQNPVRAMKVELVGAFGMFVTQGLYEVSLFTQNGFTVLQTQGYATVFALAALWRSIQIVRQMRLTERSIAHSHPTEILVMPEPTNNDE